MDQSFDSSTMHRRAAQLIPWLVNGTLDAEEAAELRAHLTSCTECRSDYHAEKRLHEAVRGDGPLAFSGESSFAKLMKRIEAIDGAQDDAIDVQDDAIDARDDEKHDAKVSAKDAANDAPARRSGPRMWHTSAAVRWLAAAVVIEAALLAGGVWRWHAPHRVNGAPDQTLTAPDQTLTAPYQTLTSSAPHYGMGPRVRVVFKSTLTLDALQKLLHTVEAHIVDGPTDAQVFTLGFGQPVTSAELDARIATLRASPEVLFAEIAAQDNDSR